MLKFTLSHLMCIGAFCGLAACAPRTETKLLTKTEFVKETVSPELLADCPVVGPPEGATAQSAAADALAVASGMLECYRAKLDGIRRELAQ